MEYSQGATNGWVCAPGIKVVSQPKELTSRAAQSTVIGDLKDVLISCVKDPQHVALSKKSKELTVMFAG